jgi:KDO2-lipid IV(A) lauroyltransferase
MTTDHIPLYRFWQPRYWPTWLVLALLRLIVLLPQPVRMACGRFLGRRAYQLLTSRRKIATRNLELCFPELDAQQITELTHKHFESLGMGVIELGMSWWCSDRVFTELTTVHGLEHAQEALERGRGVVMYSGHFAATEVSGRAIRPLLPPMAAMYRPSDNPMNDQIMRRCRNASTPELITKSGIRNLLKALKANTPVWYAADQAEGRKGTVLVPFFNEPAMTNTAISQIARVSGAPIVPFFPFRMDNGSHYELHFLPALENFPSGDVAADATRGNALLEEHIRKAPEQYYWVHRRFKGRPEGYPDLYKHI